MSTSYDHRMHHRTPTTATSQPSTIDLQLNQQKEPTMDANGKIEATAYVSRQMYALQLNELQRDENQPRKHFDEEELASLARSIEEQGVLVPILFRVQDGQKIIVAGERRCRAAKLAGKTEISAIFTNGDAQLIALVENIQREGLTAIEQAEALNNLKVTKNCGNIEVARMLGMSESAVSVMLKISGLPEDFRNTHRADTTLSVRKLIPLARIDDAAEMKKGLKKLMEAEKRSMEEKTEKKTIADKMKEQHSVQFNVILKNAKDLTSRIEKADFATIDKKLEKEIWEQFAILAAIMRQVSELSVADLPIVKTANDDGSQKASVRTEAVAPALYSVKKSVKRRLRRPPQKQLKQSTSDWLRDHVEILLPASMTGNVSEIKTAIMNHLLVGDKPNEVVNAQGQIDQQIHADS